ncbi:hypothetical protein [Mycobacterium sp. 96-892]|uniref:hypothetical protein n=1 Tax=Mycobacterium sp. 96-892 TaxID=1855664 RepID=UPI001116F8E8|nr:hypothetical protein [Mycobacterium sp. 96-892]
MTWTPPPWKDRVLADPDEARRLLQLHLLRYEPPTDDDEINWMLYLQEIGYIIHDDHRRWLKGIQFAIEQRGWEYNRHNFLRLCN